MAIVTLYDEDRPLRDPRLVRAALERIGVTYERWSAAEPVAADTPAEDVLRAYGRDIERLKAEGGYVTADVIDIRPDTPNLEAMLDRFRREHWHDEDEVRMVLRGRGVFHLRAPDGRVASVEVEPGDLLRVPRGTRHWFELCEPRDIRAIRLFQDPAGWTPHYV
jgi:1,2-dihydroxy-3-keto-5-methylthiopentene dioxygenase